MSRLAMTLVLECHTQLGQATGVPLLPRIAAILFASRKNIYFLSLKNIRVGLKMLRLFVWQ